MPLTAEQLERVNSGIGYSATVEAEEKKARAQSYTEELAQQQEQARQKQVRRDFRVSPGPVGGPMVAPRAISRNRLDELQAELAIAPLPATLEKNRLDIIQRQQVRPEDAPLLDTMPIGEHKPPPGGPVADTGEIRTSPPLTAMDKAREIAADPGKSVMELLPFVNSAPMIKELAEVSGAAYRLSKGKETENDLNLLDHYQAKNNQDRTFMRQVADVVWAMPAFALEMGTTFGAYNIGKAAAKKVGRESIDWIMGKAGQKALKSKLGKFAGKVGAGIAGGTLQAPLAGSTRIATGTMERMLPEYMIGTDAEGEKKGAIISEGPGLGGAAIDSLADTWVEIVSEHSGGLIGETAKLIPEGKVTAAIVNALKKVNPGVNSKALKEIVDKTAYHGPWAEYFEERMGDIGRAALGLEDFKLPSAEQTGVELVAFSFPMAAGKGFEYGQRIQRKSERKREMKSIVERALEAFPEQQKFKKDVIAEVEKILDADTEADTIDIAEANKLVDQLPAEDVSAPVGEEKVEQAATTVETFYNEELNELFEGVPYESLSDKNKAIVAEVYFREEPEAETVVEAETPEIETETPPEAAEIAEEAPAPPDGEIVAPEQAIAAEGGKESFGTMVSDALKWRGAAKKAAKKAEGVSRATTKGDLDKYLMKKFGIDAVVAREVSNHITDKNLKPDSTAKLEDFKGEPWADEALKKPAAVVAKKKVTRKAKPKEVTQSGTRTTKSGAVLIPPEALGVLPYVASMQGMVRKGDDELGARIGKSPYVTKRIMEGRKLIGPSVGRNFTSRIKARDYLEKHNIRGAIVPVEKEVTKGKKRKFVTQYNIVPEDNYDVMVIDFNETALEHGLQKVEDYAELRERAEEEITAWQNGAYFTNEKGEWVDLDDVEESFKRYQAAQTEEIESYNAELREAGYTDEEITSLWENDNALDTIDRLQEETKEEIQRELSSMVEAEEITEEEHQAALDEWAAIVAGEKPPKAPPGKKRFDIAEEQPTFFSQMQRTIEQKLPNREKPAVIKSTLESWVKKGEIKQEELEWSGVQEWLDEQEGKVTKGQVLDYMRENDVEIEEVGKDDKKAGPYIVRDLEGEEHKFETKAEADQYVAEIEEWIEEESTTMTDDETEIEVIDHDNNLVFHAYRTSEDQWKTSDYDYPGMFEIYEDKADAMEAAKETAKNVRDAFRQEYTGEIEDSGEGAPKFSAYQLPGGKNYQELLLTLPERVTPISKERKAYEKWATERGMDPTSTEAIISYEGIHKKRVPEGLSISDRVKDIDATFKSAHFDEPNILAHVRFNERTDAEGKKVLFIEEVQSDWHQKGRRKGYKQEIKELPTTHNIEKMKEPWPSSKVEQLKNDDGTPGPWQAVGPRGQWLGNFDTKTRALNRTRPWIVRDENGTAVVPPHEEWASTKESAVNLALARMRRDSEGVPDAPFKKTWPLLAMKKMIRVAAEQGFDKIAWTTGEQQAERYDLSKRISALHYSGTNLKAFDHSGNEVISQTGITKEQLPDYIGKEAANKLLAQPKTGTLQTLEGQDLKVGGEGMKGFYDKILPSAVQKYVKKWGAKVGETSIQKAAVHSVTITPKMREAALAGQPLFKIAKPGTAPDVVSPPINLGQVQAAFPKNTVTQEKSGDFLIEDAAGILRIKNVGAIEASPEQIKATYGFKPKRGLRAKGAYQDGVIWISKTGDIWTLRHEQYHHLEDSGIITRVEVRTLNAAVAKEQGKKANEVTAEERAKYVENALKSRARVGRVGKIIQKIRDFIDAIVNLSHTTAKGIVRDIEAGKTQARRVEKARPGDLVRAQRMDVEKALKYGEVVGDMWIGWEIKPVIDFSPTTTRNIINMDIRAERNEITPKEISALNSWFRENKDKAVRLYHGTSDEHDVTNKGLKPTSSRTAKSLQSGHGYVYLSYDPQRAKAFGEMAYPGKKVVVYSADIPISKLRVDVDQLRNKRMWSNVEVGNTLAESLLFGGGFRIKGKIEPFQIRRHGLVKAKAPTDDTTQYSTGTLVSRKKGGVQYAGVEKAPIVLNEDGSVTVSDFNAITQAQYAKINTFMKRKGYDWRGADDARQLLTRKKTDTLTGDQAAAVINALDLDKSEADIDIRKKFRSAARHFGITSDFRETGYVLPNGSMLDFSGKREGGDPGQRAYDHRQIGEAPGLEGGYEGMMAFMNMGAIRINQDSIDMNKRPTPKQEGILRSFIAKNNGEVVIDLQNGREKFSYEYPKGTSAKRILSEIKRFFAGNLKQGQESRLRDFLTRYDLEESVRPSRLKKELDKVDAMLPLGNDKFVKLRISTLIKEKIKALKRGARLGALDAREEIQYLQGLVRRYAVAALPEKGMSRGQVGPLLRITRDIKKPEDAEAAYRKIDAINETVTAKELKKKVKTLLDKYKPGSRKKVPFGGALTADEYAKLANIRLITEMSQEGAERIIQGIAEEAETDGREFTEFEQEYYYYLTTFAEIKYQDTAHLKKAISELESIIKDGQSKRFFKESLRKEKMGSMRSLAINTITGGGEVMSQEQARVEGRDKDRNIFSRVDTLNQSFETLLDKLSRYDKGSKPLRSFLNRTFIPMILESRNIENTGLAETFTKANAKLKEIYGEKSSRKISKILVDNAIPKDTGVTLTQGDKEVNLILSQNEIYKLWQAWKDPSLQETFEAMGYTDAIMGKLELGMTPMVKDWATWQLNEFFPEYYQTINAVFRERYDVDLPFNAFYSPIFRYIKGMTVDEQLLRQQGSHASVTNNHLKSRGQNNLTLKLIDGDKVLAQHIVEMEHFKAFAELSRTLRSVFENDDVIKAIRQYHGDKAASVLNKHIDDIIRGGVDRQLVNRGFDSLRANFTKAVIGANPVVFIKQLTSFPAYAMDIPVKDFGDGIVDYLQDPVGNYQTLMESAVMKARYTHGFERDIKLAMGKTAGQKLSGAKTLSDALMFMTKLGDRSAIIFGGWSVYKYHYDKAIKSDMPEPDARAEAMIEFEMATKRSQQSADPEDLVHLMREGSFAKLFTMFMTSKSSYYRLEAMAIRNIRAGRGSKAENLKRIFIAHVLLPSFFQWVDNGFRLDKKDQLIAALIGSLNGILIFGDKVIEPLVGFAAGMRPFKSDAAPVFSTVWEGGESLGKLHREIKNGDFSLKDVLSVANDMASAASKLKGIPYDSITRIGKGIYETITEDEKDLRKLIGYSDYALKRGRWKKKTPGKRRRRR